jgi:hypothetical protein
MPWWINPGATSGQPRVVQATDAQALARALFGPYPTQAAADTAAGISAGGGGSGPGSGGGGPTGGGGKFSGTRFVSLIKSAIGTPYLWAGTNPFKGGADCSGLVYWGLLKSGYPAGTTPRTSEDMWKWVRKISYRDLRPGDLIFMNFPGEVSPGHVMVYVGNGRVIQDSSPGTTVSESKWTPATSGGTVVGYGRVPELTSAAVTGDTGPAGAGAGSGDAGQITLDSAFLSPGGVVSDAGSMLHDVSLALDWFLGFWAPGQGWRIAMGAGAVAAGYGGIRSWQSQEASADGSAMLPVGVLLFGLMFLLGFMALRPWPQPAGAPEKPAAYAVEILTGEAPPAGPPRQSHVDAIELGLGTILSIWALGKTADAARAAGGILGGLGLAASKLWKFVGKIAPDLGAAGEAVP